MKMLENTRTKGLFRAKLLIPIFIVLSVGLTISAKSLADDVTCPCWKDATELGAKVPIYRQDIASCLPGKITIKGQKHEYSTTGYALVSGNKCESCHLCGRPFKIENLNIAQINSCIQVIKTYCDYIASERRNVASPKK